MAPNKPPPPAVRQEFLARLERSYELLLFGKQGADVPEDALQKLTTLRELIERLKNPSPAPERQPEQVAEGLTMTWPEFEALFSFYEEAIDSIQIARHSVRFRRPLTAEPPYPRDRAVVLELIQRVILGLKKS